MKSLAKVKEVYPNIWAKLATVMNINGTITNKKGNSASYRVAAREMTKL